VAVDLVQIRKLAKEKRNENLRFRKFLKQCDLETETTSTTVSSRSRGVCGLELIFDFSML
jgi:hypothetical protein